MKQSLPKALFLAFFLLGIMLASLGRVLPVSAAYSSSAPQDISVVAQASTPSPTSVSPVPPTQASAPLVPFPTEIPNATLFAYIEAPAGPLNLPYVTLSGFQSGSYSPSVKITGTLNTTDFICPGSPCTVPLELGETRFVFTAQTPAGASSETVYATVLATLEADGYHVKLESVSQFKQAFSDACLKIWGVEDNIGPSWAEFPQYPYQLNTNIPLHHLAARLITFGLVDTRDCPAGGLSQDLDWPNGCGLQKATPKMIEWQNQYDDAIWSAGNEVGIPPKILKTLLEIESQFWPGNGRFFVDELGLGQINQLGVDVLLRSDNALYQKVCPSVLTNCLVPYVSLTAQQQAQVRGAVMASQNSTCETCAFGVDLTKAKQSITFIAQVLRANCEQAKTILDARSATTDYESYWQFTLLSYHSGMSCLAQAVQTVKSIGDPMDWEHLSKEINCSGGRKYVDGFWANLSLFDSYRYTSGAVPVAVFTPVFSPTKTPAPTATPVISDAEVLVTVYLDTNGDGTPQPAEGLSGIPVQLLLPDGKTLSAVTSLGQAKFDLSGNVTGIQITATLPNLYRSYQFYLPQSGIVPILFNFSQPTLPGKLP